MKKYLFILLIFIICGNLFSYDEFVDPNPSNGNGFGTHVLPLSTGNVVITSPRADINGVENCGAVYLFNGKSRELISALYGTSKDDEVGYCGAIALYNGNYVVCSPLWSNGSVKYVGAVTWGNGNEGVSGVVSIDNSLIGSHTEDYIGQYFDMSEYSLKLKIIALSNGNYVVCSTQWDNGSFVNAGAITWGDGTCGVMGEISKTNSLVGTASSDSVGSGKVTALNNGNYVVINTQWDNGSVTNAGAVTWGDGTKGISGEINNTNSLIGVTAYDKVGNQGVYELSNGNYVISSPSWTNGTAINAGAVTWCDGTKGISGEINNTNSLVGSISYDSIGLKITPISNGNFLVCSPSWTNGTATNAGAVTWVEGTKGIVGEINISNSLVGTTTDNQVGLSYYRIITELSNGNYVVCSPYWDNEGAHDAGAVTWADCTKGITGPVSIDNSLVGKSSEDLIGRKGVDKLTNGNYIVSNPYWDNNGVVNIGAVTWCDGTKGITGEINNTNSLIGTKKYDNVGLGGVTALSNGNYVVCSPIWDNGGIPNAGAVTWADGTKGITGTINYSNSLVGNSDSNLIGGHFGVVALTNGNYVVNSSKWTIGTNQEIGAVTWADGTIGLKGNINATNSLLGTTANPMGNVEVIALNNGNYVVNGGCYFKDINGILYDVGAVTWGDGACGTIGTVGESMSLVGSSGTDYIETVKALTNGNYIIVSSYKYNFGVVTWGNGISGVKGKISSSNSLIGEPSLFANGKNITYLKNNNYIIESPHWSIQNATYVGAVTWGSGSSGICGYIDSSNSILGHVRNSNLQHVVTDDFNEHYYVMFTPTLAPGKVYIGNYDGTLAVDSPNNSQINAPIIYPNPASNSISTCVDISEYGNISIELYNLEGSLVTELYNQSLELGTHELSFDVSKIISGTYQLVFRQGAQIQISNLCIIR